MAYDREKLKSGYKGKFVIQEHDAEKAGKHWDVRIEFPVDSLDKSLNDYEGKRNPATGEPWRDFPDKSGSVYRSFVNRKREIPSKSNKTYLVETEDHPISYGKFEGTIPEGQYGAGKVKIYDKGTYELIEREGDKKYVMDFQGKKLNGKYALVKYKKGYLWVKTNEKKASVVDYTRPTLSPQVWDLDSDPPKMRGSVREKILSRFMAAMKKAGLHRPLVWVKNIWVAGSITTYNYTETSDIDVNIEINGNKFKSEYPEFRDMSDKDIVSYLYDVIKPVEDKDLAGTSHAVSFIFVVNDQLDSDSLYDMLSDRWAEPPIKIPFSFDPDKAFSDQRRWARKIAVMADLIIGRIVRLIKDLEKLDQFDLHHPNPRANAKKVMITAMLRKWCEELDNLHYRIHDLWDRRFEEPDKSVYPAYRHSTNWEAGVITFKFLQRWGYERPVSILYKRLKGNPYLSLIDQFIPDD